MKKRKIIRLLTALTLSSTVGHCAWAEDAYPSRPIRLEVPFPPGGSTDLMARQLVVEMQKVISPRLVVENRSGADGIIGTAYVAHAKPDGYTILLSTLATQIIDPLMRSNSGYDPIKSFTNIGMIGVIPQALVVNPATAKNAGELIAKIKAAPGKYTYGTGGSINHLTGELFKKVGGLQIVYVPFRGSSDSMSALIAGHVDMSFTTLSTAVPYHRNGQMRILAVFSDKRVGELPEVPTASEIGLKGLTADTFYMLTAPAGSPAAAVDILSKAFDRAMSTPSLQEKLSNLGLDRMSLRGHEQLQTYVQSELDKWAPLVKETGLNE